MTTIDQALAPYDYTLPQHLIATTPAHPRDSAKLLIYDRSTGGVSSDVFRHIIEYLPADSVLVFNQTKVIPARMQLTKETGGAIEALYLGNHRDTLRVMAGGKIAAGDTLTWEDGHSFTVHERDGKYAVLTPSFPVTELHDLLRKYGQTPLPPYIKDSPLSETERRAEYQTVYAREEGSVAAPTAGLHFTPELIQSIKQAGIATAYVTLHVNLGTFAPLTEERLQQKKLHEEFYEIDPKTAAFINKAKKEDRPIIAVGTTTVRTLESATSSSADDDYLPQLQKLSGTTDLFITEDDPIQFVDGLITNFHVPKSSLLMLVSAFTGRETLMDLYDRAIKEEFRFFSFGDAMLII